MTGLRSLKSFLVLTLILLPLGVVADVRLPHVFGSHMILQADKPIIIWGWAETGEKVTVTVADAKQETTADAKGKWRVSLPARKTSSTPITVTVTGKNTLTLDDVLIGEVWLGSGQSNMEMGVTQVQNNAAEIADANYPQIRLFMVAHSIQSVPQDDVEGTWVVCSPQTIVGGSAGNWGGFSATGYFFVRSLFKSLNQPVGLIQSCWGGTPIESWIPEAGFAMSPQLKGYYDIDAAHDPSSDVYQKQLNDFIASTETWIATAHKAAADKTAVGPAPASPDGFKPYDNPGQTSALYNGMIHGLEPLSIRGIIWYQGEANMGGGPIYAEKTRVQIESWRKAFAQPELPYYYTQIAPYTYDAAHPEVLPSFWETQAAALSIPHTGMIVINDIGNLTNIHPTNKQEVGRRLSLWALNKTYGKTDVVYSGPTFQSMKADGNKLRVTFDHADGLVSRDGKPIAYFEIMDADNGGFVPATAAIDGAAVVLTADGVTNPAVVRYCWSQTDESNLSNGAGLPTTSFRAGELPHHDALKLLGTEIQGYQEVYDLDLTKNVNGAIAYDVDDTAKITKPFDRIAYLLELGGADRQSEYVFVSVDAFTNDVHKIGVPTFDSHAVFQQNLTNMSVLSNVTGIVTGTGLTGGNIEFWPGNYTPANGSNVPNASNDLYDFGDAMIDPANGYGSMQIHNHDAKQTLFAINNWNGGAKGDIGIGNWTGAAPDWTHAGNADTYPTRRLRVFVHVKP